MVTDIQISKDMMINWQDITDLLAQILKIPSALIMRYTQPNIEVFISSHSQGNPYKPGDHEKLLGSGLYCERVITTQKLLKVPNALTDPEWDSNPDIKLNMISYLGFPLTMPDGTPFGTICVLDNRENHFTDYVERLLEKFRNMIQFQLELVFMNRSLGDENRKLTDYMKEIHVLRGMVPICSNCKSIRDEDEKWHPLEKYLIKSPIAQFTHSLCPDCFSKLYPENK